MKILYLLIVSLAVASHAFVPGPTTTTTTTTTTELAMGWMDNVQDMFKPMHGHGSGEKKLGEIYKEEQALLKDRQQHYNKDVLKKKYKQQPGGNFLQEFFSHPFHAQGSRHDESQLDEMYAAQQQVLYERREYLGNKDQLRRKYSHVNEDHLKDIPTHPHDPARLNKKEDEAMYVDDQAPVFEIPFFKRWNQSLKP